MSVIYGLRDREERRGQGDIKRGRTLYGVIYTHDSTVRMEVGDFWSTIAPLSIERGVRIHYTRHISFFNLTFSKIISMGLSLQIPNTTSHSPPLQIQPQPHHHHTPTSTPTHKKTPHIKPPTNHTSTSHHTSTSPQKKH